MDDDQQFCLRWNNHQSTLISVFDTLLENETLVDCTLAAEGKFLKAHKVVLSACSPYFATLLQEQYDKHPIFILKDVKYQELRAMMDYMYRGEVNISQDQLAALLKAAESLQIKGLSDNRSSSGGGPKHDPPQQQQQQLQHRGLGLPGIGGGLGLGGGISGKHGAGGGYTLEQTKRARMGPASIDSQEHSGSREGSSSPTSRRRRKLRRRSIDNTMSDVHHENSNSSQIQSIATTSSLLQQQPNSGLGSVGAIAAAASALVSHVPPSVGAVLPTTAVGAAASSMAAMSTGVQSATAQQQMTVGASTGPTTSATKKTENVKGSSGVGGSSSDVMHSELLASIEEQQQEQQQQTAGLVELKTEKQNHKQQKNVLGKDASATAGSSVTSTELVIEPKSEYDEEGNEENVEDLTLDDEDMGMEDLDHNAGTSHGNEGSSQGYTQWQHDRSQDEVFMATQEAQQRDPQDLKYDFQSSMTVGESFTDRFPCVRCGKSYLRKRHLQRHMRDECIGIPPRFTCDLCPSRFRRKYHMVRHLTSKHGIPPPMAQQATGSGGNSAHGNASGVASAGGGGSGASAITLGTGKHVKNNGYDGSDTDSPIPENLSMRKEHFEHETKSPGVQVGAVGLMGGAGGGGGGVGVVSGSSGGGGGSGGAATMAAGSIESGGLLGRDRKSPPLPTSLPTYGLTGAITAISAAAAAAVVAQTEESENLSMKPKNNVGVNAVVAGAVDPACSVGASVVAVGGGSGTIKTEPISPGKAAAAAVTNLMDDEWKMKLSLQLISNSLLKERLLNSMPFAYNNKN